MKKHIFLLFFSALPFIVQSQKTVEFNKQWNIHDYKLFEPTQCSFTFEFRSDTVINGMEYLTLYSNSDSLQLAEWVPTGKYLREDDQNRVFIVAPGSGTNEEKLLYDFNLNVGDISMFGHLSSIQCEMIVTAVDSVQILNGEFRKRLELMSNYPNNPWGLVNYWVQGIGSMTHLTDYPSSCSTDYPYDLLCYYEDEELMYSNPDHDPCFYVTSTLQLQSDISLKIFPNPVNSQIFIETDAQIENISLYDSYGRNLMYINKQQETLDVSTFPNGVYYLSLTINSEKVMRKIIIQN